MSTASGAMFLINLRGYGSSNKGKVFKENPVLVIAETALFYDVSLALSHESLKNSIHSSYK